MRRINLPGFRAWRQVAGLLGRRVWASFALLAAATVMLAAFDGLLAYFLRLCYGMLMPPFHSDWHRAFAFLAAAAICRGAGTYLLIDTRARLRAKASRRFSRTLLRDLLRRDPPVMASSLAQSRMNHVFREAGEYCRDTLTLFAHFIQLMLTGIAMVVFFPRETPFALAIFAGLGAIAVYCQRRARSATVGLAERHASSIRTVDRLTSHATLVRVLRTENREYRHYLTLESTLQQAYHYAERWNGLAASITAVGATAGLGLMIWISGAYAGTLASSLLALLYVGTRLLVSFQHFVFYRGSLAINARSFESALAFLAAPAPVQQPSPPGRVAAGPPAIRVRGLSFGFTGRQPLFRDLACEIESGGELAILGPSGVGKSTLLSLFAGVLVSERGEILVGGVPARRYLQEARIGFVEAEPLLLEGTLADNLFYGWRGPRPSLARVHELLEAMGLGELLRRMPRGLDESLTGGAVSLSMGEKQRVHLVRALLPDPEFLLLDEPTAHLDRPTEKKASAVWRRWKGKATIVIATHRESLVAEADRTLTLTPLDLAYRESA